MVILLDTNVILDFMLKREGFYDDAHKIMEMCAKNELQGYIAFHSVSIIWYLLRKVDDTVKREHLKRICRIVQVCSATHKAVETALNKAHFEDFEDCLQDQCASAVGADYIITRNVADFSSSEINAISPADFLQSIIRTNSSSR